MRLGERDCAGTGTGKGSPCRKSGAERAAFRLCAIIVDADGLNAVAQHPHLSGYFTENVIVTPHLGEMARLTGRSIEDLKRDLVESAVRYGEEKGVTCVLKDAVTVTAGRDGNVYIGDSGCAAMAKGGSGDVLTGVIAGLLRWDFQRMKRRRSACSCTEELGRQLPVKRESIPCWQEISRTVCLKR